MGHWADLQFVVLFDLFVSLRSCSIARLRHFESGYENSVGPEDVEMSVR